MDETDLLLLALQASPGNADLALVVAQRLHAQARWQDVQRLIAPLQRHWAPGSSARWPLRALLVQAWLALGRADEAEAALNQWLDDEPDAPVDALRAAFDAHGVQPRRWQRRAHASGPAGPGTASAIDPLTALTPFAPEPPGRRPLTLADVGGMAALKDTARLKIIQPLQHPALFRKYGKAAGGGILLYGPPGCGKTYFARAIAGECQAAFFNVGIQDILNMYVGNSERNLRQLFEAARAHRPAILFIDELDALGRKRELLRHSSLSTTINAFLAELDGAGQGNEGLLVLGATNAPWDIDSAFKRPGRFDDLVFVPPPDAPARQAILDLHLAGRPRAADVDTDVLAESTAQFSGADLAALVEAAATDVLQQVLAGAPERPINQADLRQALRRCKPSTGEWLATARNHVDHANEGGSYDDVAAYLAQAGGKRRIGFW